MQYTSLGSTGMTVSRICLGCMSFGNPQWRPWVLDDSAAQPFFRLALDKGINFFDTADMYSLGVSEEITGRALRSMAKLDEIVIATKVFYPMGDMPNMKGLSRKHITQACEASLKRLGIDTIDLYQVHRLDPYTPVEETMAALDHLVQSGKVRYIGASSGFAWQHMKALSVSDRHDWARFVSVQPQYNLLYREEEREMIPLCRAEGLAIIPWSPIARGWLARPRDKAKGATTRADNDAFADRVFPQTNFDIVDAVERVANARGVSMAQIAMAWLLSKRDVTAPIVGATKIHHLEDAVAALDITLSADEIHSMESPYVPRTPEF
ncbi:MAG TPA: aldo/keto reductase [Gemmatimonadaceae bacterium]|jgi:aryl-alcohol dehydrogenase-like predicted oxidoreductase